MLDFKHILGAVASAITETLWPTRCVGCDLPGTLLCAECESQLPLIDARHACLRCGAPYGRVVCTECMPGEHARLCRSDFLFTYARAACSYEGVAKRLLSAYKDHDELRLAPAIAHLLSQPIKAQSIKGPVPFIDCAQDDWTQWADALVPIPPNPLNLRKRGYDHMEPIARACADELGLELVPALVSRKAADQRLLSAEQRARNRDQSFVLADPTCSPPQHILLIDDVLTTGATCNAAAKTLLEAGAKEVRVAVFARVW